MTRPKKPTAARSLAKFSLLALILALLLGWGSWLFLSSSPRSAPAQQFVNIPPGASALKIGQLLATHQLIRSPRVFQLYVRLNRLTLQAGDYSLQAGNLPALAAQLTHGKNQEIVVTIPEGYRREQIAELLSTKLGLSSADFLSATSAQEGYLFPDTYYFAKDTTITEVIARLKSNFDAKTATLNPTREDVILASLVEREALTSAEKPIVAGILKNRLRDGWPLEVDASIQYIMGKPGDWWPTPLLGDRRRPSPYNTYQNPGLPPAPLGNPGLISLDAVKNPATTSYYFYLHDKSGNIHYATTNAEHEANIARYIDTGR